VSRESATYGIPDNVFHNTRSLDSNHTNLIKYDNASESSYIIVLSRLRWMVRRCVKDGSATGVRSAINHVTGLASSPITKEAMETAKTKQEELDCPDKQVADADAMSRINTPYDPKSLLTKSTTRRHIRIWNNKLLPWITRSMKDIIGSTNTGSIQFTPLAENPSPVVVIVVSKPDLVETSILEEILYSIYYEENQLQFGLKVVMGKISRSSAIPGPYRQYASMGASIGIENNPSRSDYSQTLGGFVIVKDGQRNIKYLGLTCHQIIQEYSTDGRDNIGVVKGRMNGREIKFCQPVIGHAEAYANHCCAAASVRYWSLGRVESSSDYRITGSSQVRRINLNLIFTIS
jgi:hypothetical protein